MHTIRQIMGRLAVVLLAALLCPGCQAPNQAERNAEIVRQMTEAINRRDFAALDELVAPDLRRHCGATPNLVIDSLEEFKAFLRQDVAAVPDSDQEIDVLFANDEYVGARCIYRGTQQGAWGPFPASGKRLELPFIGILRIEDDKVAEIWVEWDNLNALTQLGHFPPPEDADPLGSRVAGLPTPPDGNGVVYVSSAAMLRCNVRAPEDFDPTEAHDLVIGLHGFGASPDRFVSLGDAFVEQGMLFAAPQAPTPLVTGDRLGYDWDRRTDNEPDGSELQMAFAWHSVSYVTDVIEAMRERFRVRRVFLLGFSQGGAFASVAGIHYPESVSGVVTIGMGLEPEWFLEGALEEGADVPVLIAHSPEDSRIPFALAQDARELLSGLGYDVELFEYGGGHRITPEVLDHVIRWMQDHTD